MRIPAIQNDFSYYRRTISRNRLNNMNVSAGTLDKRILYTLLFISIFMCFFSMKLDIENEVNNEMANRMSLFYAEATPMLKTLSTATTNFVTEVLLVQC